MVSFQTKIPNLGKFWRALDLKLLIQFMAIWNILQTIGIFYDHLVHFVLIWYISPVLVSCTKKNLATLLGISEQKSRIKTNANKKCFFDEASNWIHSLLGLSVEVGSHWST
jgi:hypothetical protein